MAASGLTLYTVIRRRKPSLGAIFLPPGATIGPEKAKAPVPGRKAVELCDSALRLEGKERAAFLAEACAGDEALRREVESLLAWEERAEEFLTQPVLELLAASGETAEPEQLPAGLEIGPYRIVASLGRGGRAKCTKPGIRGWAGM